MYNNYFYLRRAVSELQNSLENFRLMDIYSQEKNRLLLHFEDDSGIAQNLLLSTDPSNPSILLKEKYFKAKRNLVSFMKRRLPVQFKRVLMADDDRIIKLETSSFDIYFYFKGPATNILFFESQQKIDFFKNIDKFKVDVQINEMLSKSYSNELIIPKSILLSIREVKNPESKLPPPLSGFIQKEFILRYLTSKQEDISEKFSSLIEEIFSGDISVFRKSIYDPPSFLPENYLSAQIPQSVDQKYFSSFREAMDYYNYLKFKTINFTRSFSEADSYLKKEIPRVKKKIENLEQKIKSGTQEETYRKMGDLLIMNIKSLKKGMELIDVEDYISGSRIKVKLKGDLSPKENINYYYEKARDTVKSYEYAQSLFIQTEKHLNSLFNIESDLKNAHVLDDIIKIKRRLGMKDQEKAKKIEGQGNYRHFIIEGKYHVFVGKDSRSNDLLTTRFAKQNDYWFHARGVPGSHVILRNNNPKEVMPKNILKKVASLAAFYSKSKTSGTSPVSYTFRKFVNKKKGLDPGQVYVSRENVLLVSPGIPQDCEIFKEEEEAFLDE